MKVLSSVNSLKVRWITRASGFHAVHPVVKLADGNYYVGEHSDANTSGFLESEFMFATQRWMKLDIERVVTKGTYGPAQDASAWMRESIDLSTKQGNKLEEWWIYIPSF